MINHKHWHYDRHWEWQPIKARKLQVLEFIYDMEIVTAYDLMNEFGYTYSSARCGYPSWEGRDLPSAWPEGSGV